MSSKKDLASVANLYFKALKNAVSDLDVVEKDLQNLIYAGNFTYLTRESLEKLPFSKHTKSLLNIIILNKRLNILPRILYFLQEHIALSAKKELVVIESDGFLDGDLLRKIEDCLKVLIGSNLLIRQAINPNIKNGFIVKNGGRIINLDLDFYLNQLKLNIIKNIV